MEIGAMEIMVAMAVAMAGLMRMAMIMPLTMLVRRVIVTLIGAAVIGRWSLGLMKSSGAVLLDAVPDRGLEQRIRSRLESEADRVTDLHLWRLGPGHYAAMASLVSTAPQTPAQYKARLEDLPSLSHVTVEVEPCEICETH
jgi:Co/Zn/Cd efflux system component